MDHGRDTHKIHEGPETRARHVAREVRVNGTKEGTESAHAQSVEGASERTEEGTQEVRMEGVSARPTQEAQGDQGDEENVREAARESGSEGEGEGETAQGSSTQQTQEQHPEETQDSRVVQQSTRTTATTVGVKFILSVNSLYCSMTSMTSD